MAEIKIHREHSLGLEKARKVAQTWAAEVESGLQMNCSVVKGETSDTVEFKRSGVNGRLIVAGDHFDLEAKLGFLLGAFSKTIEAEITKNLDSMLASSAPAGKKVAAKKATAKEVSARVAEAPRKTSKK